MTTRPVAKTGLHLFAGCSLALLVGAGGGAALAHGGSGHNGGDHFSNGGEHFSSGEHGHCIDCGGRNIDSNYWRHHHHHHAGSGPGDLGTVHGPGSSHNPIVYHPPKKPIRPPGAVVGPAKPDPSGAPPAVGSEGGKLPVGTVVRDHRNGKNCWYVVGNEGGPHGNTTGSLYNYQRCEEGR